MPTVSVLMPSYNHAAFVSKALESLREQTLTDWELIAIDDGSSDGSREILAEWADPRVKALNNDSNLGAYGTLARALRLVSSNFVAVLNSDDEWAPTKLEKQIELLLREKTIQVCYTNGNALGPEGELRSLQGNWPTAEVQELLPFLLEENRVLASSVVFRTEATAFNPSLRYSGDWEALLRPARDAPVGFVNEPLVNWRQHPNNSYVRSKGQIAEEIRMRRSILASRAFWNTRSLAPRAIHDGLSTNAMHLSALYVLIGEMSQARAAARVAVTQSPSLKTLRRWAAVNLPKSVALRQLWPGAETLFIDVHSDLISFR
jgi:glycosyltransferase involved in cell wall biosynthesis